MPALGPENSCSNDQKSIKPLQVAADFYGGDYFLSSQYC
jgi:hypothetical protein